MAPFIAWTASALLHAASLRSAAALTWNGARDASAAACTIGLIFAVAEYAAARRQWLRKLRMSFDERKREAKEEEGDAVARGRRRALHRALLRSGMQRLRDAAFVVTNPQHVAVALEYRPPEIGVPARARSRRRMRRHFGFEHWPRHTRFPSSKTFGWRARSIATRAKVNRSRTSTTLPLRRSSSLFCKKGRSRDELLEAVRLRICRTLLTVVAILIVPLPPWLLDVLLGINIFGSALVLLLSVTVEDPLEFSAFAPALLVATLFASRSTSRRRASFSPPARRRPPLVSIIPAFGKS